MVANNLNLFKEVRNMSFTDQEVQLVWNKGAIVSGNDPGVWRKDQCGAWINRNSYGNRESTYGWEIDHINPNGSDSLSNLRPLQWENNAERGEGYLSCPITSSGVNNVRR